MYGDLKCQEVIPLLTGKSADFILLILLLTFHILLNDAVAPTGILGSPEYSIPYTAHCTISCAIYCIIYCIVQYSSIVYSVHIVL
jgi:hypothetical protein